MNIDYTELSNRYDKDRWYPKRLIKEIIDFPPKGHPRRTKDGYPIEVIYDEFAYKRMVDAYRDTLKELLKTL